MPRTSIVVASLAVYGSPTNVPTGTPAILNFPNTFKNSHPGSYAAGTYTVQVTGWYDVNGWAEISSSTTASGNATDLRLYKNGVYTGISGLCRATGAIGSLPISMTTRQYFVAGDLISLRATTNFSGVWSWGASGYNAHMEITFVGDSI